MLQLTRIKSRNHKRHIWTSNLNPCHVLQKSQRTYCKNCALQTSQLEKICKIRQILPSRCKIHQILNESTMRTNNLIWIFQLRIMVLIGKPLKTLRLVFGTLLYIHIYSLGKLRCKTHHFHQGNSTSKTLNYQWFGRRPTPLPTWRNSKLQHQTKRIREINLKTPQKKTKWFIATALTPLHRIHHRYIHN